MARQDGRSSVLVVGGGIAGLAAGTWLEARGYRVSLVEAKPEAGGRAVTIERPDGSGDRADVGTQYLHSSYRRARALIAGAGLPMRRIRGRTRFFDERAPGGSFTTGHRLPYIRAGGPLANIALILRGLGRLIRNPVDPFGLVVDPRLDDRTIAEAVHDRFEWEFTVRTLVAAGTLVEPAHPGRDMTATGSSPDRPIADRSGVEERAVADASYLHLVRLMWIVLMTDYLSLDGGTDALHAALASRLDITCGVPATRLLWDGRARGVEMADGRQRRADHVVLAVPPHAAAEMLPGDWTGERAFLDGIDHPPAIIVTFWLDGPLEPGVWSYVMRPPVKLVSFCTDAAQKNPAMVPSGRAALQAWICWPASGAVDDLDDDRVTSAVLEELSGTFPGLAGRVEATHVQRHAKAVPQHPPGHAGAARRFLERIDDRRGVEFCGDYLTGGYMESALWSAERAVAKIAGLPSR